MHILWRIFYEWDSEFAEIKKNNRKGQRSEKRKKENFASKVNEKFLLLVCIFHTRCSLQSQSWFYNVPNQDSKNMATCPYQLTHRKLNYDKRKKGKMEEKNKSKRKWKNQRCWHIKKRDFK